MCCVRFASSVTKRLDYSLGFMAHEHLPRPSILYFEQGRATGKCSVGNLHYYKTLIYHEVTCIDYVTAYMFQMAHLDFFLRHLQTKSVPPKSPRAHHRLTLSRPLSHIASEVACTSSVFSSSPPIFSSSGNTYFT